jgi:hypothetical protein
VEDVRARFKDHSGFDLDEEQVFLVGSNPLPIVVAALALRPERGVHLIYTAEVKSRTERIAALLEEKGVQVRSLVPLNDPRSGPRIREALDAGFGTIDWTQVGLHYTGGTKPMVAEVHAHWSARRKCAAQASYLGDDAVLRFDSKGSPIEISLRHAPRLELAELTRLHADITPEHGDEHKEPRRLTVAEKIHAFVREHEFKAYRDLLPPIYGEKRDIYLEPSKPALRALSFNVACAQSFRDGAFGEWPCQGLCAVLGVEGATLDDLGAFLADTTRDKKKRRLDVVTWLWGKWLEVWLAGVLQTARDHAGGPLFHEVRQNVEMKRKSETESFFEADVVALRGHRAFLFSCTVDATKRLVKSKLFEAAQRTTQLGGDHARFAVVSFYPHPDVICKEIAEDGWQGYDTARSFGWDDLASADALLGNVLPWVLG